MVGRVSAHTGCSPPPRLYALEVYLAFTLPSIVKTHPHLSIIKYSGPMEAPLSKIRYPAHSEKVVVVRTAAERIDDDVYVRDGL